MAGLKQALLPSENSCAKRAFTKDRQQGKVTVAFYVRRGDFVVAAGLLISALLVGGGSAYSPFYRMLVQIFAVFTLCWFLIRGWNAPNSRSIKTSLILIAAMIILVVLQSIPLPPDLWRAFPGRIIVSDVLDVVGAEASWQPFSIDAYATREVGYFFVVPVAMFIATLHLDRRAQLRLMALILAAAMVSAVLVMIQAQGYTRLTIFDAPPFTKGKGIFANKNHNAALLILAIPVIALLSRHSSWFKRLGSTWLAAAIMMLVLSLAVFGTLSRTGLALLPLALLISIPVFGGYALVWRHRKLVALGVVALAVTAVALTRSSVFRETFDRFNASEEGRYAFWPDVIYAINQFLPWGSGLGTFVPVFKINESLETVQPTYVNHAHSDYLELALEAGVPGMILFAAFLIWLSLTAWSRLRNRFGTADFSIALTAVSGVLVLLAASAVDYPLRTLLLACVFAVFCAVLATPLTLSTPQAEPAARSARGRGPAIVRP